MKRQISLVQQLMVVVLVVCMNMSPANVAAAVPQGGNAPPPAPQQLDMLLAPVALYPDALLMQVLAASVNSQEVLDGGNWWLQNNTLQGDQIDSAAQSAGFGPAMTALFHFPQVVDMMCSEIDWTRQLGAAFSANQAAVLDSVQRLRLQAQQAGNLQTTPQQTVVTQQTNGQQVIVIQPANPQIIYVPQYNPVQVYVAPAPSAAAVALVAFGVGITIGALFASNNYYYPRWGYGGGVYYRGGPWVVHSYVYRPVYGPVFHPATVYRRPVNYPYAYNRPYPGNTHYNSGNYYNSYRGNTNVQNKSNNTVNRNVSGNNVTINTGNQVNNSGNKQTNQTYTKGTTTYNGANNSNTNSTYNGAPKTNSNSTYNGGNRSTGNTTYNGSRNPSTVNSTAPSNQTTTKPTRPPASTSTTAPKANPGKTGTTGKPATTGKQGDSGRQGKGGSQDRKKDQQQ